jgi:hypothetical protein
MGVMATLQELRLGYHSRAGLEPGTSRFSTLLLNHYAAPYRWVESTKVNNNNGIAAAYIAAAYGGAPSVY